MKWIGHILRRNYLLRQVIEGKIERGIQVTERWGRRRGKLLADLKERRGYSHLKEKALYRTMWRARFWRGFGPVVRQTAKRMIKMKWQQLIAVWKLEKNPIMWFSTIAAITSPNFHLRKWSFPLLLIFELETIFAESCRFFFDFHSFSHIYVSRCTVHGKRKVKQRGCDLVGWIELV
jgi:hypothetical protein